MQRQILRDSEGREIGMKTQQGISGFGLLYIGLTILFWIIFIAILIFHK